MRLQRPLVLPAALAAAALLLVAGPAQTGQPNRPVEKVLADEDAIIAATIDSARAKAVLVQKEHGGIMRRDTHAKTHGCLRGTFTVAPDRPELVRHGLFASEGTYPVWARFSSAASTPGSDASADVRGIAFKLIGTKGPKLREDDRDTTVDFLLNTPEVFPTANAKDYARLARATLSRAKLAKFLLAHPAIAARLAIQKAKGRLVSNVLFATYYSGGAFSFGDSALKYRLSPCRDASSLPPLKGASYLRAAMEATLQGGEGCFVLSAQLFESEKKTPIEDFTKEWKTPFHKVGTLVFPSQGFKSPAQDVFCENLSFTPWRTFAGHRPLGSLNRVRKALYDAIAGFRRAFNKAPTAEPTGEETFEGSSPALAQAPPPAALVPPNVDRQGLTALEQKELFHTTHGSELVPLAALRALEDPKTGRPFLENMARFGLLTDPDHVLPVGLGTATPRDLALFGVGSAIGVSCASCHVGEVRRKGKAMRILGAPSFFDAQRFAIDVKGALRAVVKDPLRLVRFLGRYARGTSSRDAAVVERLAQSEAKEAHGGFFANLGDALTKGWERLFKGVKNAVKRVAALAKRHAGLGPAGIVRALKFLVQEGRVAFKLFKARLRALGEESALPTTRAGHGRLDAFGGGLRKLFPKEAPVPNAPVSTPQLWDLERTKWYHYDGNTNSAIERNVGNALGIGVVFDKDDFASTLRLQNLYRLEELLRKVKPPKWPQDVLGPIDVALAERGKTLYAAACASCHDARAGELVSPSLVGTDPAASCTNLLEVKGPDGGPTNALVLGAKFGRAILEKAYQRNEITAAQRKAYAHGRPDPGTWRGTGKIRIPFLTGVWATGPYLHNGSVPTLDDLLRPPAERPKKFLVGSYELDPEKVGYVTKESDVAKSWLDTSLSGNGNDGHTAGTTLSEPDRRALIEFLKTL